MQASLMLIIMLLVVFLISILHNAPVAGSGRGVVSLFT